jgi:acetoin utilization deacetylase AcuC-like enzyme
LLDGYGLAYALVRPPGHHAERRSFGGFCYLNSTAVAAHFLSRFGRVAVLDIDYHHGNGTQDIFYNRSDVLTVSIHGHPRSTFPYFSGFADEKGVGVGVGYNLNIPLPENIGRTSYEQALQQALRRIRRFSPRFLVLAFGLDTAKGDPTGSWSLGADDFTQNGRLIGELRLPILVVQEGGYRTRSLGTNAAHFFVGLWRAAQPAVKLV